MSSAEPTLQALIDLVAHLRGPDGCPWDREQGIEDIRGYLLEEAHELAEAIDAADWPRIRSELGDLLFQVAFIAQLAKESTAFEIAEVVDQIHRKMIRRHPHVFGDEELNDSREVHEAWERRKLRSEAATGAVLAGLPRGLPALLAAYRMTQKASGVGFDWPDFTAVLEKVEEELQELRCELASSPDPGSSSAVRAELGDLLFTLANLARHLGHDPEATLAEANLKFRGRIEEMETELAAHHRTLADLEPAEMERLWKSVKRSETS